MIKSAGFFSLHCSIPLQYIHLQTLHEIRNDWSVVWSTFCIFPCTLTLTVLNFWKFTSYCSLKPLWSDMGEVVPARTSPTLHLWSPIPSNCASIVATSTVRVNTIQIRNAHENSLSVQQHSTQNITVQHIVSCLFTLEGSCDQGGVTWGFTTVHLH